MSYGRITIRMARRALVLGPKRLEFRLIPADGSWDLTPGKTWHAHPIPPWLARIRELVAQPAEGVTP